MFLRILRMKGAASLLSIVLSFVFLTAAWAGRGEESRTGKSKFAGTNDLSVGKLVGRVVDKETGDPLVGVNVFIQGTMIGAATDLDGQFKLVKLPPGKYDVVVSMIGYSKLVVRDVVVNADDSSPLNVSLKPEIIESDEVVVTARMLRNTESALLKQRQKAVSVSDAISAEDFKRSGLGDAAKAMTHVTGVTAVDGKYIYVRGLGDRYSSTLLNGAQVPSPDPERKAAQLDMFPTELLENIVTVKTATPDRPGNFTGGVVNVATKSFPESFTLSVSSSYGMNSQTAFKGSFLSYAGGSKDWLGFDDGTRDIPDVLRDPNVQIPDVGAAFTDPAKAQLLDAMSRSFRPVMAPMTKTGPVNQSYGLSFGNQFALFGRPLGVVGSFTYGRNFSFYDNGTSARWQLTSSAQSTNQLTNNFLLRDSRGKDEVLWGGLANFSYKLRNNHELGFNVMVNQGGESSARFQSGSFVRDLSPEAVYETRVLQYTERKLRSFQARGEHYFPALHRLRVEWNGSVIDSKQDEPDLRFFTDNFTPLERNGAVVDTIYAIRPSIYPVPTRYFRSLNEDNKNFSVDATLPFRLGTGLESKLKVGGAYLKKDRTFRERRFEFRQDAIRYDGDSQNFFSAENTGILESQSTDRFFRFGNYVQDATQLSSNYDGDEKISAAYLMLDLPVSTKLRLIGGARIESTQLDVTSLDTAKAPGKLDESDWLPSMNVIYRLRPNMNLRLAYGKTLARPTLREMAPYASFSFVGDYIFVGNADLRRTLVNNFDLRWEWFSRPGEIFAVSGFYKDFSNPIERVFNPRAAQSNPEIQFRNVNKATVYGAELELRKKLDFIGTGLRNFQFGGNFTLVHSEVTIAGDELELKRAFDPAASDTRRMMGQSPYALNLDLAFASPGSKTTASMHYNVFGARLSEVGSGGTPDIFERARGVLDFNFSQRLWRGLRFKFAAKNLLDSTYEKSHTFKGQRFPVSRYTLGRTYVFGTSYVIE